MLGKNASLLGIELHDREIRVMEIRYKNNAPSVVKVGFEPMPAGAIEWGVIQNPIAISIVLRRIIDGMGSSKTTQAVIGIPASSYLVRNLMMPPVPAADLPAIVAGEVEHYGIVRTQGGVHTYLELSSPARGAASESIPVAVLAVEEDVTSRIREVAERAGLTIEAAEPTLYAMFRTAMATSPAQSTVLALMFGTVTSDLAVVSNGQLIAYRRIETGSNILLQSSNIEGQGPVLEMMAAEALATETRRTLEYLEREYADFPVVDSVRVVIDDVGLEPLAENLARLLNLPVENVAPFMGATPSPEATAEVAGAQGLRFAAINGLAMHAALKSVTRVVALDLFSTERTVARHEISKRYLAGSVAASAVAILMGWVGSYFYNGQLSKVDLDMQSSATKLAIVRSAIGVAQQERALKEEQYRILRNDGVPIGPLADSIVSSLATGVGLTTMAIGTDLSVNLSGEASDEARMIKTVQTLQRSPVLSELMIKSFTREKGGIKFDVTAKTISMAKIKQPSDAVVRR